MTRDRLVKIYIKETRKKLLPTQSAKLSDRTLKERFAAAEEYVDTTNDFPVSSEVAKVKVDFAATLLVLLHSPILPVIRVLNEPSFKTFLKDVKAHWPVHNSYLPVWMDKKMFEEK